jgi:hypothetical protein
MIFSIRDLLLVTVIVALAAGWLMDRTRLASRNERMWNVMDDESRRWVDGSLERGSQEAMDAFLAEVRKPMSPRLKVAIQTCFVPGEAESNYATLFAKADEARPQPNGTAYYFYVEGKPPSEGSYVAEVITNGNPPAQISPRSSP